MSAPRTILEIALPAPLRRTFDYLPPAGMEAGRLQPGLRLRVPFGRGRQVGLLVGLKADSDLSPARLKRAEAVLDEAPLLGPGELDFLRWVARYYHHPLGEVLFHALPVPLRLSLIHI